MKTGQVLTETDQRKVKTAKLPYLRLVRGKYWYFAWQDVLIPIGKQYGEYGSDLFLARHFQLMHLYGLDAPDDRAVYFLGWESGPIKIGISGTEKDRRTTLQTACPYELKVWAVTTGGKPVEGEYHKRFRAHRMRGEWFERCPEIEAEIERLNA